jgi:hypothetical protein
LIREIIINIRHLLEELLLRCVRGYLYRKERRRRKMARRGREIKNRTGGIRGIKVYLKIGQLYSNIYRITGHKFLVMLKVPPMKRVYKTF